MNNLSIDYIQKEDKVTIMKMMEGFYGSEAVLTNGSPEIFSNDIEACISDSPYAEGYVFRIAGDTAGYAMLAKSFSTEFGKPCIWIEDLFVKEEYRHKGIGSAFFEMLYEKYQGVIFRLEAEEENNSAINLYKKVGFELMPYLELIKK